MRIFPIYYLYLLVAYTFNFGAGEASYQIGIRELELHPWFYLTNIYIFNTGNWITYNSPLWSLSVEEQFYLVWPFVVLFLREKPRTLTVVLTVICASSILTRLYLFLALGYTNTTPHIEVFTFANLDFLAGGGLLAVVYKCYGERICKYGLPILIGGLVLYYGTVQLTSAPTALAAIYWSVGKSGIAIAAIGLILYSLHSNPRYTVLHNPVTIHLGKISYGMYLYHNVFLSNYREISGLVGLNPAQGVAYNPNTNMLSDLSAPLVPKLLAVVVCLILVIGTAELSYRLIERPLLRMKDRFRSRPATTKA